VVERQPELLPFDFHSSATFHDPSDEAFERDCVLAVSDDSPDLFVVRSSPTDVGSDASPFVALNEIVAGIGFVVELHAMIKRVVEPLDSSTDAEADGVAVAAVVVAVDAFVVFASSGIVGFVGCRLVVNRLDLDSANVHSSFDPYSRDVVPMLIVNFDAELHNRHRVAALELAVAESHTSDDHFVDNAAIFSAGLAVDAATEELCHSLAAVSCRSSYSVAMSKPLASVWDLEGSRSCVGDN
jgi:hypothetical protein